MSDTQETVFIVDDDASVLKALERLIRSVGLNTCVFASAQDFLDHYPHNATGCLILDIAMPYINGLELQQMLATLDCGLPIIFLTGRGDIPMSVQAIKRGAMDFFSKPVNDSDLICAIHEAIAKNNSARRAHSHLNNLQQRHAMLTPREQQVLSHVISGKRNKLIAAELGITEKTIKVHRMQIMKKLQVASLVELVKLTGQLGLRPAPLNVAHNSELTGPSRSE